MIVPAFNAEATLAETLQSLRAQSLESWEAIVVDDGSLDGTAEVARRMSGEDGRIRVVSRANGGLAAARNTGIGAAQGEFVHFLDADDWMLPDGLARLIEGAGATGAAYGAVRWRDDRGGDLEWSYEPTTPRAGLEELLRFNRFAVHGQVIRRGLLGDERFDETLSCVEDHDLWLRLAGRGVVWCAVSGDVGAYRQRRMSMSRGWDSMARDHALVLRRAWSELAGREEECERVLRGVALEYATAALWDAGPGGVVRALGMMRERGAAVRVEADEAARAAAWMLPRAACHPPTLWENDWAARSMLDVLGPFWEAIEAEGIGARGFAVAARRSLAELTVSPMRVARRAVRLLPRVGEPVVAGAGRNGAAVVRALVDAERSFGVFDDAAPAGTIVTLGGVDSLALSEAEAFGAGRPVIVTPRDARGIEGRVGKDAACVRWSEVAAELGAAEEARLGRLWPGPRGGRSEAAA
ncbi:MAG: glycosyltransferase [Planctomycetota bacterium]|nr:glycosyltransferase [Planctomycetota bacterium]